MSQGLLPLLETEREFGMSLYRLMRNGIKIDIEHTKKLLDQGKEIMESITQDLGFRPSETTKLTPFLLEELKLPVLKYTPGGKPSFAKDVMEEYELLLETVDDERASQVLEFRGWQHACSNFYSPYLELLSPDGRLRAGFKMHGTITGRLSCEKPNLQQIPRKGEKSWNLYTKQCFIPEEGYELWEFDYRTLEFRLAAVYSGDGELIERINGGEDLHSATVEMIKNATGLDYTRQHLKTTNFLKLYGGGKDKLALQLKIKDHTRTKGNPGHNPKNIKMCQCSGCTCRCESCIINTAWLKTFPSMSAVMYGAQQKAKSQKYVTYWTGRRKHYGTYWNKGAEHKAFNALCQGGGAEVTKNALVRLKFMESETCRPILTVHDSLVWEIRKDEISSRVPEIQKVMEDYNFSVDMKVDAHIWGQGD